VDDTGIAVAPVVAIPAKHTRLPALDHHLRAVAIVFDFVNPVPPLWGLLCRRGKLGLDKSKPVIYANMATF